MLVSHVLVTVLCLRYRRDRLRCRLGFLGNRFPLYAELVKRRDDSGTSIFATGNRDSGFLHGLVKHRRCDACAEPVHRNHVAIAVLCRGIILDVNTQLGKRINYAVLGFIFAHLVHVDVVHHIRIRLEPTGSILVGKVRLDVIGVHLGIITAHLAHELDILVASFCLSALLCLDKDIHDVREQRSSFLDLFCTICRRFFLRHILRSGCTHEVDCLFGLRHVIFCIVLVNECAAFLDEPFLGPNCRSLVSTIGKMQVIRDYMLINQTSNDHGNILVILFQLFAARIGTEILAECLGKHFPGNVVGQLTQNFCRFRPDLDAELIVDASREVLRSGTRPCIAELLDNLVNVNRSVITVNEVIFFQLAEYLGNFRSGMTDFVAFAKFGKILVGKRTDFVLAHIRRKLAKDLENLSCTLGSKQVSRLYFTDILAV